jgi:hypothetical protein
MAATVMLVVYTRPGHPTVECNKEEGISVIRVVRLRTDLAAAASTASA